MNQETAPKTEQVKRIGGYLHRVVPIMDNTGKVLNYALKPLMVELKLRDILQIIVGSTILAIPVAFTEETWNLGQKLPLKNVISIAILSIFFIALFVYFNFYRLNFKGHVFEYIKRVFATYFLSLIVVSVILILIEKCPWGIDNMLALKRTIIVTFPASMSATISDILK